MIKMNQKMNLGLWIKDMRGEPWLWDRSRCIPGEYASIHTYMRADGAEVNFRSSERYGCILTRRAFLAGFSYVADLREQALRDLGVAVLAGSTPAAAIPAIGRSKMNGRRKNMTSKEFQDQLEAGRRDFRGETVEGSVYIYGVIDGDLDLNNMIIENHLDLNSVTIAGHLDLCGTQIGGDVDMRGLTVKGPFYMYTITLMPGASIKLNGAQFLYEGVIHEKAE
jgi:hypothetical protein